MNPIRTVCLLIGIFAFASANTSSGSGPLRWQGNSNSVKKSSTRPADWLTALELESLPSTTEVTLEKIESLSVQEGADMLNKMFYLSMASQALESNYVPKTSEIPAYLVTADNKKIKFKLSQLPKIAQEDKEFGNQEVTIFITGLPDTTETVKKAIRNLVQAYMQRYNGEAPKRNSVKYEDDSSEKTSPSSSEEDELNRNSNKPSGTLVVIELGNIFENMKQYVSLDVEKTGAEIGDILLQLTDKADVPFEIIHVIGANIAAHVAGAVGRQYTRETGHQLRRITGLDPTNLYTRSENALKGLARGDAEFVDVIHTSAYGLGTASRCGDVDFYPNGPSEGVPGAKNLIEASMRSIRYFAESVVPGNERNFPAVGATSLQQYKEQNGNGKRVYMGINTDFDAEGDFILQVNSKSPFGRSTPAQKQQNHRVHKPWKMSSKDY
ncbi:vitellogenin-2-like [Lucilia sericata]|uniref:vitellogenin-2-like n=1 Tax=Lucilia sericata TaxID=13632 RepID=UPI0018A86A67|nr:vitellogenin-2-like [Lucilia sericata]